MNNNLEWTEWKKFPDPRKGDYLLAPFGSGVYQLKNTITNELILFGSGKNIAYRMTSLLPEPFGRGTRNNMNKRKYILDNIKNIEYRTIAILDEIEMKVFEKNIKLLKNHLFDT